MRPLLLTFVILGVLLLCSFQAYRYLDSLRWFVPKVDERALSARVRQEQPLKGTDEAATLAFVRSLGIEDRNIRIIRYRQSQGGNVYSIEGWFPQPIRLFRPRRVVVRCTFDPPGRLAKCGEYPDTGEYSELGAGGSIEDGTPPPVR